MAETSLEFACFEGGNLGEVGTASILAAANVVTCASLGIPAPYAKTYVLVIAEYTDEKKYIYSRYHTAGAEGTWFAFGAHVRFSAVNPNPAPKWLKFETAGGVCLTIRLKTDGKLGVYDASDTLVATTPVALQADTTYRIEGGFRKHDTSGAVWFEVYDPEIGSAIVTGVSVTGIDTDYDSGDPDVRMYVGCQLAMSTVPVIVYLFSYYFDAGVDSDDIPLIGPFFTLQSPLQTYKGATDAVPDVGDTLDTGYWRNLAATPGGAANASYTGLKSGYCKTNGTLRMGIPGNPGTQYVASIRSASFLFLPGAGLVKPIYGYVDPDDNYTVKTESVGITGSKVYVCYFSDSTYMPTNIDNHLVLGFAGATDAISNYMTDMWGFILAEYRQLPLVSCGQHRPAAFQSTGKRWTP